MRTPFIKLIIGVFLINSLGPIPVQAQDFALPKPGVMVHLSPSFNPPMLKGLKVHTDNPFKFDFVLDQGDNTPAEALAKEGYLKQESTKLIKYFLASLTVPENDLWVNLSPYEKNRVIPEAFGKTEMGRDLLAQDYLLKQITASLIYPEEELGKQFWQRVYAQAQKEFGTTNIPVNTFNKVWIVPSKAVVYENTKAGTAYVVESKLKVMLEQDYLALEKSTINSLPLEGRAREGVNDINTLGSQIVKEIVLPQLEKEVNEGKNFTQLRQVYQSLILAAWYKKKIKDSILAKVYSDKSKVAGLNSPPLEGGVILSPEQIYQQYLQAFKKGVFNYVKEDSISVGSIDGSRSMSSTTITRKYFSGGFAMRATAAMTTTTNPAQLPVLKNAVRVQANFAMLSLTADEARENVALTKRVDDAVGEFNAGHPMFQLTMVWSNEKRPKVNILYPDGEEKKTFLSIEIMSGASTSTLKIIFPQNIAEIPRVKMFLELLYRDLPPAILIAYENSQLENLHGLGILEQYARLRVKRFQESTFPNLIKDFASADYLVRDNARSRLVNSLWPKGINERVVSILIDNILNPSVGEDSDSYNSGKARINARLTSLYAINRLTEDISYGSQIKVLQERLVKESASYQVRPEIDVAVEAYNYNNPDFAKSERALASLSFFEHLCCLAKAVNKGYFVVKDRYKWIGASIDVLIEKIDVNSHPQIGVLKGIRNSAMSSEVNKGSGEIKSDRRKVILLFVITSLAAALNGLYLANNGTGIESLLAGKTKEEQLFICTEEYRKRLTDASKLDPDSVRHYFYKELSLKHLQNRMNKIAAELEKPMHAKADAILEQAKKDALARGEEIREHILRTFQYEKSPEKMAYGAVILFRKGQGFLLMDGVAHQWALNYYQVIEENKVTKKKELKVKFVYPNGEVKEVLADLIMGDVGAQEFVSDVPYKTSPAQASVSKEQWVQKRSFLQALAEKIRLGTLPEIINFGDKHGEMQDLPEIIEKARQMGQAGRRVVIIGHGDYLGIGEDGHGVYEKLNELKDLQDEFSGLVEVHLLMGNHEKEMIDALLLADERNLDSWVKSQDGILVEQFGVIKNLRDVTRSLASMLEISYLDEAGFLHVHAGVELLHGLPVVSKVQLMQINKDWEKYRNHLDDEMQRKEISQFLNSEVNHLYEIRGEGWHRVSTRQGFLDDTQAMKPEELDMLLAALGVYGFVVGHDHHPTLLNIDGRIFGIDFDIKEQMGHLSVSAGGIKRYWIEGERAEQISTPEQWLANIDDEIKRIDGYISKFSLAQIVKRDAAMLYGKPSNVSRSLQALQDRYRIFNDLDEVKDQEKSLLLIGVGRGYAAIELALRYPKLHIVAVNKEKGLWSPVEVLGQMRKQGHRAEEVVKAIKRIELKIVDMDETGDVIRNLERRRFDFVVFEGYTQMYFKDKIRIIERMFNDYVKVGGVFAFIISYMQQQELFDVGIDMALIERVDKSLKGKGSLLSYLPKENDLNLKYRKLNNKRLWIPLRLTDAQEFTVLDVDEKARHSYYRPAVKVRAAMVGAKKGGIDLTDSKLPLEVQGDGEGLEFNISPAMLSQYQNAPGFVPIIINIEPLGDLRQFLGANQEVDIATGAPV